MVIIKPGKNKKEQENSSVENGPVPASVARFDARPAGYQEVAGSAPAGLVTFFHGE